MSKWKRTASRITFLGLSIAVAYLGIACWRYGLRSYTSFLPFVGSILFVVAGIIVIAFVVPFQLIEMLFRPYHARNETGASFERWGWITLAFLEILSEIFSGF